MNWAQLRKYTPKEWWLKAFCLCLKHSLFPYVAEQCSEKGLSSELSHQSAITECFDSLETLFRNHSKMAQLGDNTNNATCTIYPTLKKKKKTVMTRRFQSATGPIAGGRVLTVEAWLQEISIKVNTIYSFIFPQTLSMWIVGDLKAVQMVDTLF